MVFVVIKIITQELEIESNLKQRLEFICEFCHIKPTIINGSIRKIDKTNLSYIEPHKVIVKDTTFLALNYSTDIYVGSLNKKIQLVELEDYIKNLLNVWFYPAKMEDDKVKIYDEIEELQPQIKELYNNRRYCDGIYKWSINIQNNIDNFDKDIDMIEEKELSFW